MQIEDFDSSHTFGHGDTLVRYVSESTLFPRDGHTSPVTIADLITERRAQGRPTFSCEFFPPKTVDGRATLFQTIEDLAPYRLDFVAVTYGAGGSTQTISLDITQALIQRFGIPTLAHLTCVGATRDQLRETIAANIRVGVDSILALRGDPKDGPGTSWVTTEGGFSYAIELVEFIRQEFDAAIAVAVFPEGHPESTSLDQDADILVRKSAAGADFGITNLFFSADHYFDTIERLHARDCDIPVLPGLMPLTNISQIERFSTLSGAEFPELLRQKFLAVADDPEAVIELGIESTTKLAEELLAQGAPGIHMYTLNRSRSTAAIFDNLGVASRP